MAARILEDNYIYISHLDEGYQFWKLPCWPDEISDSMQSNFTPTTALGRTAPVYTFNNSGPRTVQINLPLHRDIMDDVNSGLDANLSKKDKQKDGNWKLEGEDYVDALIRALQAIAVPKYNLTNKLVEPPIVALRLGNEIFVKGIVSGAIGITFSKPIRDDGKYAVVNLSLQISEIDPYDATSVFTNGGFRGVVRSMKKGMGLNIED